MVARRHAEAGPRKGEVPSTEEGVAARKLARMVVRSSPSHLMAATELFVAFVTSPDTSPKFCSRVVRLETSTADGATKIIASSAYREIRALIALSGSG